MQDAPVGAGGTSVKEADGFSLALGGPLYQFWRRTRGRRVPRDLTCDSRPPLAGAEASDYGIVTSLGYSFQGT